MDRITYTVIAIFLGIFIGATLAEDFFSDLERQAIQYGYAHYVGEDQKWEWIKPKGVK